MQTHTEMMRVNWVDTDASGRIHYTAALRYFEVAEHGLMRKLFQGGSGPGDRAFNLPRVHVECDYHATLGYPDEFECTAHVQRVGRSSVTYAFRAARPGDGELCLTGQIIAVAVGASGRSMPLPEPFRAVLEAAMEESSPRANASDPTSGDSS